MNAFAPFLIAVVLAQPAVSQEIAAAKYIQPTDVYGHGAVADGEYTTLKVTFDDGAQQKLRLSGAVYEDTEPRLADLDGDGAPEVIAVMSDLNRGAMIQIVDVIDGMAKEIGHSAPIGEKHRWLAIAGVTDIDGDGRPEIAYVDRPHLAKVLRLVTVAIEDGHAAFTAFAEKPGLTNHQYRSAVIEGGVRDCEDDAPVIVTADADWGQVMETRWTQGKLTSHAVAPYESEKSFLPFLDCD